MHVGRQSLFRAVVVNCCVGPPSAALPTFGCEDERLETALLVAGLCCVNETIATAWLEASLRAARTELARAANRVHLRDEIDHARLGWPHSRAQTRTRCTP
jgi:hypothetical protein